MKRRDFLFWVGVGGLATSLPAAIAAYLPSPAASLPSQPQTEEDAEPVGNSHGVATVAAGQFVSVGTVAELNAKGFLKRDRPTKLIVIRDPNNPSGVLALTSVCNHLKCTVELICPMTVLASIQPILIRRMLVLHFLVKPHHAIKEPRFA